MQHNLDKNRWDSARCAPKKSLRPAHLPSWGNKQESPSDQQAGRFSRCGRSWGVSPVFKGRPIGGHSSEFGERRVARS